MSAHLIFDNAPIGSLVAWSDGTPQPSQRFTKKLAAWRRNNGRGRGIITIRVHRSFSQDSTLRFTILERPPVGSVRVFDRGGRGAELVYLAAHHADAQEWLSRHGYPHAVFEDVTADEVSSDVFEGTAA